VSRLSGVRANDLSFCIAEGSVIHAGNNVGNKNGFCSRVWCCWGPSISIPAASKCVAKGKEHSLSCLWGIDCFCAVDKGGGDDGSCAEGVEWG